MASKLYVAEFGFAGLYAGSVIPIASAPAIAEQTVDYSGGVAASAAFNAATNIIRVHTDTACSIQIGMAPSATTSMMRLPADAIEYFMVPKGASFKISAIAN